MLELVRFDLLDKNDLELFISTSIAYYTEVCTKEECEEEIADLYDEQLTSELIKQTQHEDIPYYIMKIITDSEYAGFIAYFVEPALRRGFINNFYVTKEHRSKGFGTKAYRLAETHIKELGATYIELEPVESAVLFYQKEGYSKYLRGDVQEIIFRKALNG